MKILRASTGLIALVATAFLIYKAFEQSQEIKQVAEVCHQATTGNYEEALRLSDAWKELKYDHETAVVCRALALLESGQKDACGQLVWEAHRSHLPKSWIPPERAALAFLTWATAEAHAPFVTSILKAYPNDLELQKKGIAHVSLGKDPTTDLDRIFAEHASNEPTDVNFRLWVGQEWMKMNRLERAREAVQSIKTIPAAAPLQEKYFDLRLRTQGASGDGESVVETSKLWQERGGHPADVRAKTALVMNAQKLKASDYDSLQELKWCVDHLDSILNPNLQRNVATRLLLHHTGQQQFEKARQLFARLPARLNLPTPEALVPQMDIPQSISQNGKWQARFRSELATAVTLWVSPENEEDHPLAPYRSSDLQPSGATAFETKVGRRPLRWVAKAEDTVVASGTQWPSTKEVVLRSPRHVERNRPTPAPPSNALSADGVPKVIALFLDCADWHLIQYGRQLGVLPSFERLIRRGFFGAMRSDPPVTAMAMEKIVWPERKLKPSVVSHFYQVGVELGGLASVGKNPFDDLQFLLPKSRNFFDVMGAGKHSVANMLFSHGSLKGGRHALLYGPQGVRKQLHFKESQRALTREEAALFPGLKALDQSHQQDQLQMMAAQMDMVADLYRRPHPHLLMMRIEPLDILTHELFKSSFKSGNDRGDTPLLWVYRYLDHRLGEIMDALQSDDLLLVYSDHGIETSTKHHEVSFFSLFGARVLPGQLQGQPEIAGIPQLVGRMMGHPVSFPDQDLADQVLDQITPSP